MYNCAKQCSSLSSGQQGSQEVVDSAPDRDDGYALFYLLDVGPSGCHGQGAVEKAAVPFEKVSFGSFGGVIEPGSQGLRGGVWEKICQCPILPSITTHAWFAELRLPELCVAIGAEPVAGPTIVRSGLNRVIRVGSLWRQWLTRDFVSGCQSVGT
jgi:hypothetical protein